MRVHHRVTSILSCIVALSFLIGDFVIRDAAGQEAKAKSAAKKDKPSAEQQAPPKQKTNQKQSKSLKLF